MILVTGAGGNVGRPLLGELAAAGTPVRAAYRSPDKVARAKADGLDAVMVDYASPDTLRPALDGVDALFLLATGAAGQVEGETNVVRAAKAAGVRRIVKLSVFEVTKEEFEFARLHRAVERAIEESGLAWTFLRPASFMQNFVNFMAPTIRSQRAMYTMVPDSPFSHVDTRDVARVAGVVLTRGGHDGQAYTLTGPRSFSYREAARTIGDVTGQPVKVVALGEQDLRAGMKANGVPDFYADYLVDLDRWYESGKGDVVTTSIRDITGREPTTFEEFVGEFRREFGG
ncbi:MAG TPA: SDR family oxidoreductase [Gemmatimonadaceae bacterium]|nr:SDR family oxidoreductase [Gemmatimonadaceae bacterium]